MEINHQILWLWIKELLNYNNKKALKLVHHFENVHAIYYSENFSECTFLTEKEMKALKKKDLSNAWDVYHDCEENQISILTINDKCYPELLREIDNPPAILFVKGHLKECLNRPCLTVVGTRNSTGYSEEMTKTIVTALCQCGFSIVCGTADGIDRFARETAIRTNSGPIVILPFGHLSSRGLMTRDFPDVLIHGAIISEYYPRNGSHKNAYHERNRILSGLSLGTFVVHAPKKSGALITANYAAEQNRDVFALMSNATKEYEGSNNLIKEGCYPVTDYTDIVQIYLPHFKEKLNDNIKPNENIFSLQEEINENELHAYKKKHSKKLTEAERAVFALLTTEECTTDYIIENAGIPMEQVLQALTTLEFSGLAISCPGSKFKIIL